MRVEKYLSFVLVAAFPFLTECITETDRQTEKDRERETETERQRERQRERATERQRHRPTERWGVL